MRLSSLSLPIVLLFVSVAFAQHHDTSAPSAPPPPPVVSPSPPPSSSAPSPSVPHTSASSNAASSTPETHIAPSAHAPKEVSPEPRPQQPDQRIEGDKKIASSPRVGENSPEKPAKSLDSDLRKKPCEGKDCKEPAPKPEPAESDARRKPCLHEPCPCPPGETMGKGGCTASPVPPTQCQPGSTPSGAACQSDCSIARAQTENVIARLRSAHQERDNACRQDPNGTTCQAADLRYQGVLSEYRAFLGGVGAGCLGALPDPISI